MILCTTNLYFTIYYIVLEGSVECISICVYAFVYTYLNFCLYFYSLFIYVYLIYVFVHTFNDIYIYVSLHIILSRIFLDMIKVKLTTQSIHLGILLSIRQFICFNTVYLCKKDRMEFPLFIQILKIYSHFCS
jgi:hypothetical protein